MFAALVLATLSGQTSLASTPEWRAYLAVLAKHKTILVNVYLRPLPTEGDDNAFGSGFESVIWPDGSYSAEGGRTLTTWNAKESRGIFVNRSDKTWTLISNEDNTPTMFFMLGIGKHGKALASRDHLRLTRITREIVGSSSGNEAKRREIGYETYDYHVDAGYRAVWLFDAKTHLLTQLSVDSLGPMATETHAESMWIEWKFDQKVRLSLAPPKGFKETKIK